MDVTTLPYNQLLGLKPAEQEDGALLELPSNPDLLNHLNTVHASAIFSIAEASSGQVLADLLSAETSEVLPVLRRGEIKYRNPGVGVLVSKADLVEEEIQRFRAELNRRGRALVSFQIRILDSQSVEVAVGQYEWFVTLLKH